MSSTYFLLLFLFPLNLSFLPNKKSKQILIIIFLLVLFSLSLSISLGLASFEKKVNGSTGSKSFNREICMN